MLKCMTNNSIVTNWWLVTIIIIIISSSIVIIIVVIIFRILFMPADVLLQQEYKNIVETRWNYSPLLYRNNNENNGYLL